MLEPDMQKALNKQINEEYYSSYVYASMANYFEHINLHGFAGWMRRQSDEEQVHAKKIVAYINNRGGRVLLTSIAAPATEWDSPLAAMETAYKHECHISACINELASLAMDHKDHATLAFLKWFVDEQVEEEATVDAVVQQLKLVADAPSGLFLVDRDLAHPTTDTASAS